MADGTTELALAWAREPTPGYFTLPVDSNPVDTKYRAQMIKTFVPAIAISVHAAYYICLRPVAT